MPITTQFSKHFYDTLGHEVADELVAWFNSVDASYRTEFSELFKLYFDRFNDRLEREIGGVRSEFHAEMGGLRSELHAEVSRLRSELRAEVSGLRSELHAEVSGLRSEMENRLAALKAELEQRIAAAEVRLIRWMFVFWMGSIGTMIALK